MKNQLKVTCMINYTFNKDNNNIVNNNFYEYIGQLGL